MQPPEMRRLKQLEDENARLKKIVADLSLDRESGRRSPKNLRPAGRKFASATTLSCIKQPIITVSTLKPTTSPASLSCFTIFAEAI
jgi:hypothetical protein